MQGQPSPQKSNSGFAQPAAVRHYLSNMINAPIPSVASPVKRPTRRQDPDAGSQGCFSPNKWAATRMSEAERNIGSNPNVNPSVNPSSTSLSAKSELTPAETPYGTPQVTPTKAAGGRPGAGVSISELIRSAREGVAPQQVMQLLTMTCNQQTLQSTIDMHAESTYSMKQSLPLGLSCNHMQYDKSQVSLQISTVCSYGP